MPVTFVLVLGYAVDATDHASEHRGQGPPPWRLRRIYAAGQWMALALALLSAPFALALVPLANAIHSPGLWHSAGALLDFEALVGAALLLALPWGIVLLLLMPHATARFATTRQARHLFDFPASLRSVRRDFASWNIAVAAIVTAWALGVACVGLLCVGLVPGIFYGENRPANSASAAAIAPATAAPDPEAGAGVRAPSASR